ncbi:MAG: AAA family ATPase, partial [Nitrospiraceae bacterium]|nr:AAA family ATPase [Nitrospiraceae bacterium]
SQRETSRQLSVRYLELANRLVQAYQRPALVLTMGLSGTGKTMVAKKLEVLSGIRTLHSDVIRKDLFQGPDARTGQWNDGMYRPENKMQVYEKMFKEAENSLKAGDSICLDASFLDPLQREMAVRTAERQQAALTVLLCQCDEAEVREHLSKRKEAGEDPSDADFAIYLKQKAAFTGPAPIPASRVFSVDTSGDIPEGELELLAPFFKG